MSFRYDLTAVEILKLLGYTEPVGKDTLLQAEREKNLKLPPALFGVWRRTAPYLRPPTSGQKGGTFAGSRMTVSRNGSTEIRNIGKRTPRNMPITSIISFTNFPK